MAKRYLTKEEKRNFIAWSRENENGTLLTSETLQKICADFENDPRKIGEYMLSLNAKSICKESTPSESDFDCDLGDIPCV